MKQIYLDRDQCKRFELEYFGDDQTTLRADEILASKFQGYDKDHTEFLQGFGSAIVRISRIELDSPGWFSVNAEIELTDSQLDNVAGGMSSQSFDIWRARVINESH